MSAQLPRKKILFTIRQLGRGGTEKRMIELANSLKTGWDVKVLSLTRSFLLLPEEMPECEVLMPKHSSALNRVFHLRNVIRNFKPDIIHSFDLESGIYASIASLFLNNNTKHISGYGSSVISDIRLKFLLARKSLHPDLFICNSYAGAKLLSEKAKHATPVKIIHNGLNQQPITYTKEMLKDLPDDALVIGYIGKFDHKKHAERLIDVAIRMEKHPLKPYFVVVGNGIYRKKALAMLDHLPEQTRKRIILPGEVANAAKLIKRFTIGTLVSDSEGFPNVLLEYMRAGLPWVSTNVGDVKYINTFAECGIITGPWDPATFTGQLTHLLENAATRNSMGEMGKKVFNRWFTIEQMTEKYEQEYQMLLK